MLIFLIISISRPIKAGGKNHHIELSEKVLTSADRLRCTLIHELCHAATWIFNNERGHGQRWKLWVRSIKNNLLLCHSTNNIFLISLRPKDQMKSSPNCQKSPYAIITILSTNTRINVICATLNHIHIQSRKKWKIYDAVIAME